MAIKTFIIELNGNIYATEGAENNINDIVDFIKEQTKKLRTRPKTIRTTNSSLGIEYTPKALEYTLQRDTFSKCEIAFGTKYKMTISKAYKMVLPAAKNEKE
jgi:hypothetical protein